MMAVTLCIPPRPGELCALVRFDLTEASTFMELTARHRITAVETDEAKGTIVLWVEISDPATARPVHVRFDVVEPGADRGPRTVLVGDVEQDGHRREILGTYLGVVSEEN
jgi:hypothetical protein